VAIVEIEGWRRKATPINAAIGSATIGDNTVVRRLSKKEKNNIGCDVYMDYYT
jgi:hypothetical protein